MINNVFLKPKAAADWLGVSQSSLAKWRMTRDGPRFCLFGRAVRYRAADLEQWADSRSVSTGSAA